MIKLRVGDIIEHRDWSIIITRINLEFFFNNEHIRTKVKFKWLNNSDKNEYDGEINQIHFKMGEYKLIRKNIEPPKNDIEWLDRIKENEKSTIYG